MNIIDMRSSSMTVELSEYKLIFGSSGEHVIYDKDDGMMRIIDYDGTCINFYDNRDIEISRY